jgi:hypothetical protein
LAGENDGCGRSEEGKDYGVFGGKLLKIKVLDRNI